MKKIILATVLAGIGSTAALAADMGGRTPYTKAPAMMAAVSNWSGFYVGGNVGYGWGNSNTDFSFLPDPATFGPATSSLDNKSRGTIGGAQIGYNWQMGTVVTGLEADIQGSGIKGSARLAPFFDLDLNRFLPGSFMSSEQKLSWFGTLRGRLGFTVTPVLLVYATGGLAYGHVDASANTFFNAGNFFPASVSKTKVGWTAGAGAEWAFAGNWSTKFEYLYIDLGSLSAIANLAPTPFPPLATRYTWKAQENIVRVGVNYHFN
jgi:outer membrane immunogenic protein